MDNEKEIKHASITLEINGTLSSDLILKRMKKQRAFGNEQWELLGVQHTKSFYEDMLWAQDNWVILEVDWNKLPI